MIRYKFTITAYGTYPATTGNPFTLCDDTVSIINGSNFTNGAGGVCMDGFLGDCDVLVQPVTGYRAPYRTPVFRANLLHSFDLKVTRNHDNEIDAFLFLLTHFDLVPRYGLLQLTATTGTGTANAWLAGAVIGKIGREKQSGTRMLWTYPITGAGPWLTKKPGST